MTASAPCGCDEAKQWKDRALRAELGLKFARQQMNRLLGKIDEILAFDEDDLEIVAPATRFDEIKPGSVQFTGGSSISISVSPLSEMHDPTGVIGFSGGTDEERQAAVDALDCARKGDG